MQTVNSAQAFLELIKTLADTAPDGFAVIEADSESNRYIQISLVHSSDNDPDHAPAVYLEASANQFIGQNWKLSPARLQQMLDLGWQAPGTGGSPNYSALFSGPFTMHSATQAAALAERTFSGVFDCAPGQALNVSMEDMDEEGDSPYD